MTLLCFAMTGCLKEPPVVPSIPGQQIIELDGEDVEVCQALEDEFDHYELHAPFWADSVEWSQHVGLGAWTQLGTDTMLLLPVAQGIGSVQCLLHWEGDTIIRTTQFFTCHRFVIIPTAFDRWYLEEDWRPIISGYPEDDLNYVRWEVRSLDGTILFETDRPEEGWNGRYNGQWIGTGTFLYNIRVFFNGEDVLHYTGMFVMLG